MEVSPGDTAQNNVASGRCTTTYEDDFAGRTDAQYKDDYMRRRDDYDTDDLARWRDYRGLDDCARMRSGYIWKIGQRPAVTSSKYMPDEPIESETEQNDGFGMQVFRRARGEKHAITRRKAGTNLPSVNQV